MTAKDEAADVVQGRGCAKRAAGEGRTIELDSFHEVMGARPEVKWRSSAIWGLSALVGQIRAMQCGVLAVPIACNSAEKVDSHQTK